MTLRDYLRIFRRRWLIILASVLVTAGVTFLVSSNEDTSRQPTGYSATATLLVGAAPTPTGTTNTQSGGNLSRVALFVKTGEIPQRAASALGAADPVTLASGIEVTPDSAAGALTITAKASQAERAAATANAFTDATVAFYEGDRDGVRITVLQRATPVAIAPSGGFIVPPGKLPRSLIAGALGLLFGLALALIVNHLDTRLRTRDQVAKALRMPVIAEVPKLRRTADGTLGVLEEPLSPYADAYRSARTAITHLPSRPVVVDGVPSAARGVWGDQAPVVLLTSGLASEGKTTSVANLAASFAETGQKVLVVDADLRKPDTHLLLDVPQSAGVSDYLVNPDAHPLRSLIRPTRIKGVSMITAGTALNSPTALVSRLEPVLEGLRSQADVVIVDSAPLLAASDVFDLLPLVDTVLIVVRSGRLTDAAGERIAELLGRFNVPVIGALLIGAPVGSDGYGYGYGRGHGYGRGYGYGQKKVAAAASEQAVEPAEPVGELAVEPARRAGTPPEPVPTTPDAAEDAQAPVPVDPAPRSVWTS